MLAKAFATNEPPPTFAPAITEVFTACRSSGKGQDVIRLECQFIRSLGWIRINSADCSWSWVDCPWLLPGPRILTTFLLPTSGYCSAHFIGYPQICCGDQAAISFVIGHFYPTRAIVSLNDANGFTRWKSSRDQYRYSNKNQVYHVPLTSSSNSDVASKSNKTSALISSSSNACEDDDDSMKEEAEGASDGAKSEMHGFRFSGKWLRSLHYLQYSAGA